ncbi:MAG: STAS domain-containing protein [Spirochaetaceae bacterium]|nr:MAG: STAS domain-containing protein [Spirochaetaceae bacterium]
MIEVKQISKREIVLKFKEKVTPEEIENETKDILTGPCKTVSIDCSEVYTLDHTILGKLYMLKLDLSIRHKNLIITGCSKRILNVLKMIRFDNLVQIIPEAPRRWTNESIP